MVVLEHEVYANICSFIRDYVGPSMDCEVALKNAFPQVGQETIESILAKEWQQQIKLNYPRITNNIRRFYQEYEKLRASTGDTDILLKIAVRERFPPIGLCRILLSDRYRDHSKSDISEMLRNPYSVPDPRLAANVLSCLYADNRDGPISDIIRQCVGEEYEVKMKELATAAGLHFYDEGDLRRGGYDKTPDLKLAVPCMFRGRVVNWIESKASFGDMDSHNKYMKDQLCSYANRFGPGVVIYWFGYLDEIDQLKENTNVVTITDKFPDKSELELFTFTSSSSSSCSSNTQSIH